jgi:putative membrane protein
MDSQVELAKERNRIAAERTLLTWIRQSLTLISLGFGTSEIVNTILGQLSNPDRLVRLAYFSGLVMVALGTYAVSAAAIEYWREIRKLEQPEYIYTPRRSLGAIVAAVLIILVSILLYRVFY